VRRSWSSVLLVAALAGCGDGGGGGGGAPGGGADRARPPAERSTAARPPSDTEQLDRLLAARSAALGRGDARALAATATGAQRARDRRAARRARGLGLRRTALSVQSLELTGRRATMRVRSLYSLRGIPGRFGGDRRLVAVRTAQGWRVARETSRRERHPWELGPVVRRRSRHFVVLAPRGLALAGLRGSLERGYRRMDDVLPDARLPRRSLVVVAGTAGAARRLTRGIRGVAELAAITDSRVREAGPARRAAEVVSQRLLVIWPVYRGLQNEDRDRIVAHELTHVALAGATSGRTPAWLIEGLALYISEDRRVTEAASVEPRLGVLSRPDSIARVSGAGQRRGYALSSAAAFYIAERFGERGLLDLYDAYNDESIRGGPGETRTTDRALRKTLGISLRRLERDLRAWLPSS